MQQVLDMCFVVLYCPLLVSFGQDFWTFSLPPNPTTSTPPPTPPPALSLFTHIADDISGDFFFSIKDPSVHRFLNETLQMHSLHVIRYIFFNFWNYFLSLLCAQCVQQVLHLVSFYRLLIILSQCIRQTTFWITRVCISVGYLIIGDERVCVELTKTSFHRKKVCQLSVWLADLLAMMWRLISIWWRF